MTAWLVTGIILLSAAIVLMFRPVVPPVLAAYAGLWTMSLSRLTPLSSRTMLFWGVAVIIVLGIDFLRQRREESGGTMRTYIAAGSLTGMVLGLLISPSFGGVAGSAAGAVLALAAYRMTPSGRGSRVPAVAAFCSVGLPVIVTCSIVALALQSVIAASALTL